MAECAVCKKIEKPFEWFCYVSDGDGFEWKHICEECAPLRERSAAWKKRKKVKQLQNKLGKFELQYKDV